LYYADARHKKKYLPTEKFGEEQYHPAHKQKINGTLQQLNIPSLQLPASEERLVVNAKALCIILILTV
jgi:hypothetical protein